MREKSENTCEIPDDPAVRVGLGKGRGRASGRGPDPGDP